MANISNSGVNDLNADPAVIEAINGLLSYQYHLHLLVFIIIFIWFIFSIIGFVMAYNRNKDNSTALVTNSRTWNSVSDYIVAGTQLGLSGVSLIIVGIYIWWRVGARVTTDGTTIKVGK